MRYTAQDARNRMLEAGAGSLIPSRMTEEYLLTLRKECYKYTGKVNSALYRFYAAQERKRQSALYRFYAAQERKRQAELA